MDSYQKRLLQAINKRESCSLRNHVTVWNSYHTDNQFTSAIRVQNETVATLFYILAHDDLTVNIHGGTSKNFDDMMKNDKWEHVKGYKCYDKALYRDARIILYNL